MVTISAQAQAAQAQATPAHTAQANPQCCCNGEAAARAAECCNGHVNGAAGAPHARVMRLSDCRAGQSGVVHDSLLEARDGALLRAMGLRPRARVRVCRLGEPCIIEVFAACPGGCSCRIGLSLPLARQLLIAAD